MSSNDSSHTGEGTTGPGTLIAGRYRIEAIIGTGGMATVYRAVDTELGRTVALKVFRTDVVDAASVRRQAEEIRLIASLDHPALVTLYDAVAAELDDPSSRGVLVMQFVDGADLRARLAAESTLPSAIAAAIGADVASALAYVHAQGVIHRDVSPANVLLPQAHGGGAPVARLADFGIARLVDSAGLTSTGTVIGTATYLSPEQARGGQLRPASDVYSLGLVLLESLTGQRAFPGTAVESVMARLAADPVIPDDLGKGWRTLLAAMTAREPEDRPTAAEVVKTLRSMPAVPAATKVLPAALAATELLPATPGTTELMPEALQATKLLLAADVTTEVMSAAQPTAVLPVPSSTRTERLLSETSVTNTPTAKTPTESRARPNRAVIVLAVLVAALLVAVAVFALTGLGGDTDPQVPATGTTTPAETPVAETPVEQTPEPSAAPEYPVVEGPLGDSLAALQDSVADTTIPDDVRSALQSQVLAISTAAANGEFESALDQLDGLNDSVENLRDDDALTRDQADAIQAAADRAQKELEAAQKAAEKDEGNGGPGNSDKPGNGNGP